MWPVAIKGEVDMFCGFMGLRAADRPQRGASRRKRIAFCGLVWGCGAEEGGRDFDSEGELISDSEWVL